MRTNPIGSANKRAWEETPEQSSRSSGANSASDDLYAGRVNRGSPRAPSEQAQQLAPPSHVSLTADPKKYAYGLLIGPATKKSPYTLLPMKYDILLQHSKQLRPVAGDGFDISDAWEYQLRATRSEIIRKFGSKENTVTYAEVLGAQLMKFMLAQHGLGGFPDLPRFYGVLRDHLTKWVAGNYHFEVIPPHLAAVPPILWNYDQLGPDW